MSATTTVTASAAPAVSEIVMLMNQPLTPEQLAVNEAAIKALRDQGELVLTRSPQDNTIVGRDLPPEINDLLDAAPGMDIEAEMEAHLENISKGNVKS